MKTHNKKWAIKQMLDGKRVVPKWAWGGSSYYYIDEKGNFMSSRGNKIQINTFDDTVWALYEEPEKVELPEEIPITTEVSLYELNTNRDAINQIIKYLKEKGNN